MDWSRLIDIIIAVLASGGLWTFLERRGSRRDAKTRILMGIAHDTIVSKGHALIKRGYITPDEYNDLHKYYYDPYLELDGNGLAEKIMAEVDKLPIRGD